jgi:hypothetical protein
VGWLEPNSILRAHILSPILIPYPNHKFYPNPKRKVIPPLYIKNSKTMCQFENTSILLWKRVFKQDLSERILQSLQQISLILRHSAFINV